MRSWKWRPVKGEGWEVDDAIGRLIADGTLDRGTVITECLAALTRADKPSAQRVMPRRCGARRSVLPTNVPGKRW